MVGKMNSVNGQGFCNSKKKRNGIGTKNRNENPDPPTVKVPEGHHPRGTTLREALQGNCLSEGSGYSLLPKGTGSPLPPSIARPSQLLRGSGGWLVDRRGAVRISFPLPKPFFLVIPLPAPKNLSKRAVDVGMLSTLRATTAKLGKVEQCSDHHCKGETRNDGETKTASYLVICDFTSSSRALVACSIAGESGSVNGRSAEFFKTSVLYARRKLILDSFFRPA